ncbi:MAG TPA: hydroxyphenylacetyl-CoA thioesterase PaaI [Burkholderiales bacterium]|nr:hydroxyphenylacetyl-CoA thioesterase PaaI [Burkholderiales bacterium]
MNPQELAEEIIRRFGPMDRASHLLGIRLLEVRPGHVRMSMRVIDTMVNAQQICHGGLIFTLADTSFGYASNSHNQRALAASCSIEFLAPAQVGDELTAEADEVGHLGRTRVYDVRVTNQDQALIALFRGKSTAVKGAWVE